MRVIDENIMASFFLWRCVVVKSTDITIVLINNHGFIFTNWILQLCCIVGSVTATWAVFHPAFDRNFVINWFIAYPIKWYFFVISWISCLQHCREVWRDYCKIIPNLCKLKQKWIRNVQLLPKTLSKQLFKNSEICLRCWQIVNTFLRWCSF